MIERIGKYQVIAELGRGGMGRVYRAHDPSVDRDVAIKVLTSEGDPDLLGRFRSEAGTTGKLNHKNIVTVHGYGEQDDMPYLVMELLQGEDLARVIREQKPLTLLEKVRIMYQVAEGLSYAHQNSVIHRDIKPANIMLLPDGTVKIMDFGIARVTSRNSTRRTQKGFLLGTISYMAPEQFRLGLDADQLVDIFAYGDVFYELITGVHPFHAEDPGTVMYRITAMDPKPVRELAPDCPESLSYIIHQLLAKDRELRYQSLRDALLDIEPTLFELRQHRATEILAEVQPMVQGGQLEAALIKVKEALELDPMSREARQLRDRLQQDLHRQAVRVKLAGLLEEGDSMVAQRRFGEALQVFENALRLEKSDTVQARLDLARRELEKTQRAARLYADARREVLQGNFTSAFAIVNSAVELDPFNTEAAQFSKRLSVEIEERERERRIDAAVQFSARQVEAGEFAQALDALDGLIAEVGQAPPLLDARRDVLAARSEAERRERRRRLNGTLDTIRRAIDSGDLAAARGGVELLYSDFGDVREAVQQAEELGQEVARRQHDSDVAMIEQEARELARQNRFSEARGNTEAMLARYPNDPRLLRVLEALARVQASKERADAIARANEEIESFERGGRLEEALESARNALNQFRDHAPFRDTAARLDEAVRQKRRAAAIADAVERGTALAETDPAAGVSLLRAAISKLGRDDELQVALAMVEAALERKREQEFIQELLTRSATLRASGEWRKALDEVERGLGRYPDRIELKATASEIRAELYRRARAEKLQDTIIAIEKAMRARDWRKSEALLKTARQEFHGETRLDELQADLQRRQHSEAVAAIENAVRQSFSRDDLAGAERQLNSAPAGLKSDRMWESLNVELDRRKTYLRALKQAETLDSQERFAEAEQVLGQAAGIPIADPRAEELLRSVKQRRARAEALERERLERERRDAEAREKARLEAEARERERLERERQERERKEAEAREKARLESEARERERLERERLERERKQAEAREKARLEAEARERERLERERLERERLERERREAEAQEKARLEAEAREKERLERERQERERKEAEAREKARLEAEARERERLERLERERREAEAQEKARLEAEAREKERLERERQERERKEAEAREKARLEAEARERERLERERKEAEAREKARLAAEARERERLEREHKKAEAREKARLEAESRERAERERKERERKDAQDREKARLEAEAREREERESEERERAAAATQVVLPPVIPGGQDGFRHAAAGAGSATMVSTAEVERVNGSAASVQIEGPAKAAPVYQRALVIGPAALLIAAAAFFLLRPGAAPTAITLHPSPAAIALQYQDGSSTLPSADVNFEAANVGFSARSTAAWLAIEPPSGDHLNALHVSLTPANLKPGAYDARIEIAPSDANKYTFANAGIPVRLTITEKRAVVLKVAPSALQFDYRDGGPIPGPKEINVSEPLSSVHIRWEDASQATWARFEKAGGALRIRVQPYKGLTVGAHTAALLIELPGASNGTQRVAVSLKVTSGLGLSLP